MRINGWIEGDGEMDQYGIRLRTKDGCTTFVTQGHSRSDIENLLSDLWDQFVSLRDHFDEVRLSTQTANEEVAE